MGWVRGIFRVPSLSPASPAIVRERTIGFRHPVRVLALLYGVPPVIGRIEQFRGKPLGHRFFVAFARGRDDPANTERLTPRRTHFDRHLVGGAAAAPRAHFDR